MDRQATSPQHADQPNLDFTGEVSTSLRGNLKMLKLRSTSCRRPDFLQSAAIHPPRFETSFSIPNKIYISVDACYSMDRSISFYPEIDVELEITSKKNNHFHYVCLMMYYLVQILKVYAVWY